MLLNKPWNFKWWYKYTDHFVLKRKCTLQGEICRTMYILVMGISRDFIINQSIIGNNRIDSPDQSLFKIRKNVTIRISSLIFHLFASQSTCWITQTFWVFNCGPLSSELFLCFQLIKFSNYETIKKTAQKIVKIFICQQEIF